MASLSLQLVSSEFLSPTSLHRSYWQGLCFEGAVYPCDTVIAHFAVTHQCRLQPLSHERRGLCLHVCEQLASIGTLTSGRSPQFAQNHEVFESPQTQDLSPLSRRMSHSREPCMTGSTQRGADR